MELKMIDKIGIVLLIGLVISVVSDIVSGGEPIWIAIYSAFAGFILASIVFDRGE